MYWDSDIYIYIYIYIYIVYYCIHIYIMFILLYLYLYYRWISQLIIQTIVNEIGHGILVAC